MQLYHPNKHRESAECPTLTVESVESWSTGVTVVSTETQFADAGPGLRVRSAGVVHSTGCTALAVCTEPNSSVVLGFINKDISTEPNGEKEVAPLTDDLSCWFGLSVVVVGGVGRNGWAGKTKTNIITDNVYVH